MTDNDFEEISPEQWDYIGERSRYESILDDCVRTVGMVLEECDNVEFDQFSILVMLHSYLITGLEAYLSNSFIHHVLNSDQLIRNLVESNDSLGKEKISFKDIYVEHENIKSKISDYLKDQIFHNIKKIKSLFKAVLDHQFEDLAWLFEAVEIRHDCVHRGGYKKNGERVELSSEGIQILIERINSFTKELEDVYDDLLFD